MQRFTPLCLCLNLIWIAGCAATPAARQSPALDVASEAAAPVAVSAPPTAAAAAPGTPSATVAADPLAYLRRIAARTDQLERYTLTLTRTERRGLFRQLKGPERIACWFRREPFSVRMKWLDPDVKYGESAYVAGQQGGQVRFIPRRGLLGLPPSIARVDVQTPVTWGEARRPVTDFGLQRQMQRTLAALADAGSRVTVSYMGIEPLPRTSGQGERAVHHFRFDYAPGASETPEVHFFADAVTDLPARTRLLLPSGELDGEYDYDEVNAQIVLSDEDFLLDAERAAPRPVPAGDSPR